MTLLAVGLSHRSTPVDLLERVALGDDGARDLLADVAAAPGVEEAVVVATCNRLEVYVAADTPEDGLRGVTDSVARRTGVDAETFAPHLYVHDDDRAVQHVFALACGLESMVVGESQILGQVRAALRDAQERGTVGRTLNDVLQHALRVGKRVRSETGIDRAGRSVVATALDVAASRLGGLSGRRAVLVGAGSMGGLATALLRRAGVSDLVIVNRTPERAARLAASAGGRTAPVDALADELRVADVLVSCTGAVGAVVPAEVIAEARTRPDGSVADELVCLDLALPHDIDPAVEALPGVTLVGLADLADIARRSEGAAFEADLDEVRRIAAEEVGEYVAAQRAERVAPTLVALRDRADEVVQAEVDRLLARVPELDPRARDEVAQGLRRVASTLLHAPTVRMKELAGEPGGETYTAVLQRLFDLDADLSDGGAS